MIPSLQEIIVNLFACFTQNINIIRNIASHQKKINK